MHVKARSLAFGGVLLALAVVFMSLGSIIETSTLFLLAAASYFVGIVIREFGLRLGATFYVAAVLLGMITAPNKFYVLTFSAMGFYIWGIEAMWRWLERRSQYRNGRVLFGVFKFVIFDIMYIPIVIFFRELLFGKEIPSSLFVVIIAGGQIGLFLYDKAYEYFQSHVWGKFRERMLS